MNREHVEHVREDGEERGDEETGVRACVSVCVSVCVCVCGCVCEGRAGCDAVLEVLVVC